MSLLKSLASRLTNAAIKPYAAICQRLYINIQSAQKLTEIKNLKKLKGHKNFFRIRVGDYRIGIAVQDKKVILAAFDHHSDIYKYFP
ncbi:type II toxin-antitoxin system RelE/ParE family toxin [Prolixibacter sp. SD074]|uniref:type II toxin-antitoxin system RelE family toxin n=1 Tax=Prolixibacter sp. SD074 TaxID=2652391 RepID=UPI0012994A71|nr:type II toxin-antitoxin system RelE/ParE family toxin [Prolixibacter sp. SD074]